MVSSLLWKYCGWASTFFTTTSNKFSFKKCLVIQWWSCHLLEQISLSSTNCYNYICLNELYFYNYTIVKLYNYILYTIICCQNEFLLLPHLYSSIVELIGFVLGFVFLYDLEFILYTCLII